MVWPAVIAAGASLAAGALGEKSKKDDTRRQQRHEREFAQHGIRWRVADAKAAGLHPLAALGAQGAIAGQIVSPSTPMADSVAQAGQAISQGLTARQMQKAGQPPAGPVVYPAGSSWPHYSGPSGKAIPYSAQQAQSYMALQNAQAQIDVAGSTVRLNNAQANQIGAPTPTPDMFTMYKHPRLGNIPFPNPDLGESAEALTNNYIAGQWMKELSVTNEKLYSRIIKDMAEGRSSVITELLGAAPELANAVMKSIKQAWGKW